jgi:hypothetical protein
MSRVVLFIFTGIFFCISFIFAQDSKTPPPTQQDDITLVKNVFKKIEEATIKKDITSYLEVFSKRVEIESPDGKKLSYTEVKDYLVELFELYEHLKEEAVKDYEIKLIENTAEVIYYYRLSGVLKGEKERTVIDEGIQKITLIKIPSFSPKSPPFYQITKISFIFLPDEKQVVSEEDKKDLITTIKENYGIDVVSRGGFDLYRSALLQDLKAENDALRDEMEIRIAILKKRLEKTLSLEIKKELVQNITELEQTLQGLPTDADIMAVVDNEIAELKEIFLK